eukprot:COSAG01_NODE_43436_length_429_cov_128.103030_1_plen_72_part_10
MTPEHQVFWDALSCIKSNILFKPVDRTDFRAGYEQVSRRTQLTNTLARSTDKNAPRGRYLRPSSTRSSYPSE